MSDKLERAYENAFTAYGAIHAALSYAVEAALDDCDYDDAIKYAKMMAVIEEVVITLGSPDMMRKPPSPPIKG